MQTLTLAATKAQLCAVLDRVERGEEVVITRRGRPVARLVPEHAQAAHDTHWIDDLAAFVDTQAPAHQSSVTALRALEPY